MNIMDLFFDVLSSKNIVDLIPQLVGETYRYDLRNRIDISVLPQRTTIFQNSCIPSSVRACSSLDKQCHNNYCQTYGSFCYIFKTDLNSSVKIPNYYYKGNHKLASLHCRLCNRCSDLHADLFYNHLSDNALSDCQQEIEDGEHFIFRCNRYEHERVNMLNTAVSSSKFSDALIGKRNLSVDNNSVLFEAIQTYLNDTRCFNDK